jgi:CHAT domain-containing protein/Tfp pilus assembly protein PilF
MIRTRAAIALALFVAPASIAIAPSLAAAQVAQVATATTATTSADDVATRLVAATDAQRSQQVAQLDGDLRSIAKALIGAGDKARAESEFPRAVVAYETAQALSRRAGSDTELGLALNGLADTFFRQGVLDRAENAARDSVVLHERLNDPGGLAQAWNAMGNVRWTQGRMQDSLVLYQKARPLFEAAHDRLGLARVLNNLGEVSRNTGATDEALEYFQQARGILEELGDRRRAAVVIDNIGIVYFWRGEYPSALDYARRALEIRESLQDRYGLGKSYDSLGNVYAAQGAYARALDAFHRALQLRTTVGDSHGVVETSHNIGLVYYAEGQYRLAIDAYKRGLRLNAPLGDRSFESEAMLNIAAAAWRLGERPRAEANFRAGLQIAEQHHLDFITGEILQGLGEMARAGGRTREATSLFGRALVVHQRTKDQAGISGTLTSLASLKLGDRQFGEAVELSTRAAETARANDQPEQLWEALAVMGAAYRRLGRIDAARRSLTDAIAGIERLRRQVGGADTGRERFLESRLSPYHELISLATESHASTEALEVAERSKARALADLMQKGRLDLSTAMTPDEKANERRLRSSLLSLNERIQKERVKDAPDETRLASLVAERGQKRQEYEAFQDSIHAAHPELRLQRGDPPPFVFGDANRLLADASTAILEYVATDAQAYMFVLTREDNRPRLTSYVVPASSRTLASIAGRFRERIAARDLSFVDEGHRLYDLLIAPARAQLAGKTRVIVVPDGALWNVPFQALQDANGRYLVESVSVAYVPSLTVMREILRKPASQAPPNVLAMGKSEFGSTHARPALALMSELGPLPEAERQVRLLPSLYGPGRATTYLGDEASEDRFKAEASRYSVLHLATHGVLDESSPLYSHVVLSPGGGASREDGLLEAWEMLELPLDADVVILSACETGRGRIAPGEGIVGTMWALFVAGARAMVVSQWKVEATSTTELMTAFHRGLASRAGTKAEHLRQASLALLRSSRYSHPFYWAGFVLVGNPS